MSPEARVAPGLFVAVVGPSGAGKDTLIAGAARHPGLPPSVRFARRIVTRDARRETEDHDSLDVHAFARAEAEGVFGLTWKAHGLSYALPRSVEADLREHLVVVANVSRRCLGAALERFGTLAIVEVTARPELLMARIAARGRESDAEIGERLARQAPLVLPPGTLAHLRIDNSDAIEAAIELFVSGLDRLAEGMARGFSCGRPFLA